MGGLSPDPLWAELVQILVSMVGSIVVYTKWDSLLLGPPKIMTTQIYRTTVFYSCVHVSDINNLMMIINIILIERDLAR